MKWFFRLKSPLLFFSFFLSPPESDFIINLFVPQYLAICILGSSLFHIIQAVGDAQLLSQTPPEVVTYFSCDLYKGQSLIMKMGPAGEMSPAAETLAVNDMYGRNKWTAELCSCFTLKPCLGKCCTLGRKAGRVCCASSWARRAGKILHLSFLPLPSHFCD